MAFPVARYLLFSAGSQIRVSNDNSNRLGGVPATEAQHGIRLDVQGLRAIAVLAVLAYHTNSGWMKAGFVGVDVFFVISGFIITALLTERAIKVELGAFYLSRIKRILPAYFVMLTIVCMVSAILFLPDDFEFFRNSLKSASLFFSNHYFADFGSYFAPKADELPLLHTWSLAIEMQFYLFFPLLVICLPKGLRLPVFTILALGLFAWSGFRTLEDKHDFLYFSLIARIPEFMVGAVVALVMCNRRLNPQVSSALGVLGAILLALSFTMIERQAFPGFWSILPCLGAGLVIAARRGPVSALLSTPLMVWIGGISYSLYLWHWPVLALVRYYTGQYELTSAGLLVFACCSLALAWLSYRYVEIPVRSSPMTLRQVPRWVLAGSAVLLVAWGGRQINGSLVSPLPLELTRYAASESICHGIQVGECKRGAADAPASVLVIGDSHAAQLNYFFDVAGNEQGIAYRVLTGSSCVPIPGFDVQRLPGWAQKPCRAQMTAVAQIMPQMKKLIVAGMWQYQMQSPVFVEALRDFLQSAADAGKQIVVLAQIPMFESNVQRVRRFTEIGLAAPLAFNREWSEANRQVEAIAKGIPGVQYLDFSTSSFFAAAPYQDGQLIYRDSHHLNELGARRYGYFAAGALQRAFDQPQSSVSLKP